MVEGSFVLYPALYIRRPLSGALYQPAARYSYRRAVAPVKDREDRQDVRRPPVGGERDDEVLYFAVVVVRPQGCQAAATARHRARDDPLVARQVVGPAAD